MKLGNDVAAIVTGGASGLGAATARALAAKGVKVAIFDLNEAQGTALAKEIGGAFGKCDVTSEASVDAALAAARKAHGQERIIVNCAGIAIGKRIARKVKETGAVEAHDVASFAKVIQVNLVGTFTMIAKSAAGMLALSPLDAGRRARRHHLDRLGRRRGWSDRAGRLRGVQGRRDGHDAAGGARSRPRRRARVHDNAGPFPHADVRRPAGGGAQIARRHGAIPVTARPPIRVWRAGCSHC